MFVDRWCNSGYITVKEQACSKNIKLLAVRMRPHYLPSEFTQVIVFAVYIPPSANTDAACDVLHSVTSSLQTQHPQALFLISWDLVNLFTLRWSVHGLNDQTFLQADKGKTS